METVLVPAIVMVYFLFEAFRTYIYIRSLGVKRKKRYIAEPSLQELDLAIQLCQEQKENRLMSAILEDLVKEP